MTVTMVLPDKFTMRALRDLGFPHDRHFEEWPVERAEVEYVNVGSIPATAERWRQIVRPLWQEQTQVAFYGPRIFEPDFDYVDLEPHYFTRLGRNEYECIFVGEFMEKRDPWRHIVYYGWRA